MYVLHYPFKSIYEMQTGQIILKDKNQNRVMSTLLGIVATFVLTNCPVVFKPHPRTFI